MNKVYKTLKAQSKIAMSFIGRTFARLRHIQRISKLRVDAVQLVVKESMVIIYLDGCALLQATKQSIIDGEWSIEMTVRLKNLLETKAA